MRHVGHVVYVGKVVILHPCQRETHIRCDDGQVTGQVQMEYKVSKFGGLVGSYCMGTCLWCSASCTGSVTWDSVDAGFGFLLVCLAGRSLSIQVRESLQRLSIRFNMLGRSALLAGCT